MTNEKPAPTAAEIAEAQEMLNLYARIIDPPIAGQWVRTLLAALDAAEARATAAEALAKLPPDYCYSCGGTGGHWEACHGTTPLIALSVSLRTAERERDELRDALKLYEAFPELATGDTARRDEQRAAYNGLRWVLGLLAGLDDGRQDSVAKAFRPVVEKIKRERDEARAALKPGAIVVSDSEETRERIARALAVSDGYKSDASRELVSTFLADTDAVLAALREPRP